MLLESDLRVAMAWILLLLAACDRGSAPQEQVRRDAAGKTDVRADIGLESVNGLKATLTYKFAGYAAPDAVFSDADGRDVTLQDFGGRPLLVNLWATWCAPCKAEMPALDALAAIESGRISVVAVSQDLQGKKPVRAFFESSAIRNLEPYTDSDNALLAAFDHRIALPTTILYDSDSREIWRVTGGVEWDDDEMTALLSEAE